MALNMVPFANNGVKATLSNMELAVLKLRKVVATTPTESNHYNATIAVIADYNIVTKSNGDQTLAPNLGKTFVVRINKENLPDIHGIIPNVRLINPVIHTIYTTSSENSTFATVNCSISAQGIEFSQAPSSNGFNNKYLVLILGIFFIIAGLTLKILSLGLPWLALAIDWIAKWTIILGIAWVLPTIWRLFATTGEMKCLIKNIIFLITKLMNIN